MCQLKPTAAVILCGGQSRRMGRPKAALPWGGRTMLEHVADLLRQVPGVEHLVLVAAPEQSLPRIPGPAVVVRDRRPGVGPLEGLACGLRAAGQLGCPAAYVTSCDVPALRPELVRLVLDRLPEAQAAVPVAGGHKQVLAAAYRTELAAVVDELLEQGLQRPRDLLERIATTWIAEEELRRVDPKLASLENLNTPEDYRRLLLEQGMPLPDWLPETPPAADRDNDE